MIIEIEKIVSNKVTANTTFVESYPVNLLEISCLQSRQTNSNWAKMLKGNCQLCLYFESN